jgi:hypothetical protein
MPPVFLPSENTGPARQFQPYHHEQGGLGVAPPMRAQRFGAVSDWLVILICERSTTAHAASPMETEAKQEVQSPSQGGNGHGDLQMARKTSKSASKDVKRAMRKRKKGTLKSGRSGKTVKSKKRLSRLASPKRARRERRLDASDQKRRAGNLLADR